VTEGALPASFRDPSGFLFYRGDTLYRQINDSHRAHYDGLVDSGLYGELSDDGLLIPHQEVEVDPARSEDAYKIIQPEPITFISYPYEWCFGQLKDAALLTLRAQRKALDRGMSLQDASAYNVQWRGGKPILIDTLSFVTYEEGRPWIAYRQFCQHFLAPLALMAYRDVRLGQLARVYIDGVPLDLAASLLPVKARSRPSLAMHIFAHSKSQARHADSEVGPGTSSEKQFSRRAFSGLIESLETAVRKLEWNPPASEWSAYYEEGASYSEESARHKEDLVRTLLQEISPKTVWDLGANVGHYSRIAAAAGASTVSFDIDATCVEANYRQVVKDGEDGVLPLVLDLTNPSPSLGWAHAERSSLLERGPVDAVMALALVHHLAIANNVPLERVASYLGDLGNWLIIEFVPKDDPMVQRLLASREDIFPDYTRDGFERAISSRFSIERTEDLSGSSRVLYLMRRKGG
jgi:cyclopropane fatty-acyl-phospholipid synthase-like methyltransferase